MLLIDAKAPWEKPCGGGLTAAAMDLVPDLQGLLPHMQPVRSVRLGVQDGTDVIVELERPMWMVSRSRLSRWQLDRAVGAGAVYLRRKVRSIDRYRDTWRLETDGGAVEATHLLGADGAASLVRKVAAPSHHVELASTRVGYAPVDGAPETLTVRFIAGTSGYLWDFPRRSHRSVGIGFFERSWRREKLDLGIDAYLDSDGRCGDYSAADRRGAVIGTAGIGHGDFTRVANERFALLGDAAGFADPLTGEGILNALRSADLLAEAWTREGSLEAYPASARRALGPELQRSRLMRSALLRNDPGFELIASAGNNRMAYSTVAAVINAINEHRLGALDLVRAWWRGRGKPDGTLLAPPALRKCGCAHACNCTAPETDAAALSTPECET